MYGQQKDSNGQWYSLSLSGVMRKDRSIDAWYYWYLFDRSSGHHAKGQGQ
ncbi:hypothetical protein LMG8526HA_02557 [Lactococcus lactis]|nr:hypothetical protein [Lactococcus lactis]